MPPTHSVCWPSKLAGAPATLDQLPILGQGVLLNTLQSEGVFSKLPSLINSAKREGVMSKNKNRKRMAAMHEGLILRRVILFSPVIWQAASELLRTQTSLDFGQGRSIYCESQKLRCFLRFSCSEYDLPLIFIRMKAKEGAVALGWVVMK